MEFTIETPAPSEDVADEKEQTSQRQGLDTEFDPDVRLASL
ncbi:MAG: hypothetical protein U5L09_03215 [Bacteroidales bacterium]|nr:hypothetical protein [Bacteroidales bacterium]